MPAAEPFQSSHAEALLSALMVDVYHILKLNPRNLFRRPVGWLTRRPLLRFCQIFAETDSRMARDGFVSASTWLVRTWFARAIHLRGRERVPAEGPLLVVSNHPGAIDSVSLAACLGREDLRIISSDIPLMRRLPSIRQHLIFIAQDSIGRMHAIRESIRHLQAGGALLVFPTGLIDPDPGFMPGSAQVLENWSNSLEIFLRKAPKTRLQPVIVSHVLHPQLLNNPLARLERERWKRQRMAELLQFLVQMLFPQRLWLEPRISFGQPIPYQELEAARGDTPLKEFILQETQALLEQH